MELGHGKQTKIWQLIYQPVDLSPGEFFSDSNHRKLSRRRARVCLQIITDE
jgi:hypothetical protein